MLPRQDLDLDAALTVEADAAFEAPPRPLRSRLLLVLWPAFMVAALLEALVFVVLDPDGLNGTGAAFLMWPASAIYSMAFLVFWALISLASATTLWLDRPGPWRAT
jgi:hypothetical protein